VTATQTIYQAAGHMVGESTDRCWLCGGSAGALPSPRALLEKDTFTNHDQVGAPNSDVVCAACVWCHDERHVELQQRTGKPVAPKFRNYSHVVKGGEWLPFSKGQKAALCGALLTQPFPTVAAVADSGQKQIVFRTRVNPAGANTGWVQFEELPLYVVPLQLTTVICNVEKLYRTFAKGEIESGNYSQHRVLDYGLVDWRCDEAQIAPRRGSALLSLALFLAQREEDK